MREDGFLGLGVADDEHRLAEFEMFFGGFVFEEGTFENEQIDAFGEGSENLFKACVSRIDERFLVVFDANRKALARVRRF
jgi:hypothetical protein